MLTVGYSNRSLGRPLIQVWQYVIELELQTNQAFGVRGSHRHFHQPGFGIRLILLAFELVNQFESAPIPFGNRERRRTRKIDVPTEPKLDFSGNRGVTASLVAPLIAKAISVIGPESSRCWPSKAVKFSVIDLLPSSEAINTRI